MGNGGSKRTNVRSRPMKITLSELSDLEIGDSNFSVGSIHQEDLRIIDEIKREFDGNNQVFMLNNIILGVQFFTDHKEAIIRLQHEPASLQEKEMNKTLLKEETMECTYPDVLMEEVNKNVIFRPVEECSIAENLVPKRIYITTDLIEVVSSTEIPQYTSIDKPLYQARLEDCNRKGYLKIKLVENNTNILSSREPEEPEEEYEDLPGPSSQSDSEYEYTTITNLRTPKALEVDTSFERRDTLPKSCFSSYEVLEISDEDLELYDDHERLGILEQIAQGNFRKQETYVNSYEFMNYFQNTLFPISLGEALGFDQETILSATAIPGKIFCEEKIDADNYRNYQIIPAVSIPWPEAQTLGFWKRDDRPTIMDKRTGVMFKWPAGVMISEMENMTAVLVPKGYTEKRGVNKDANLEWEIHFPKAERYLEARMSHAQIKCFLLLLTLHKTFIAPYTGENGLLPEHIRTHMYWECEQNWMNWPEHRLGTKILLVLNRLKDNIFKGSLKDYFIREKDLFKNIPKKYLLFAQKVFLDILSNPVPHFILALRNLRYTSGKFYPPLNLMELYNGLRTKTSAALVNPDLLGNMKYPKKKIYEGLEQHMQHLKEIKIKEKIIMQRRKEKEEKKSKEILKKSSEDIDLENPMEKKLDIWKTKAILVMFIKLYIEIAKKSASFSSNQQAMFYLKQAFYLAKILEEQSSAFLDEVAEFEKCIALEESRIKRKSLRSASMSEEKPPTPVRNSISFQFNEVMQQPITPFVNASVDSTIHQPAKKNFKALERSDSAKQNSPTRRKTVVFQI